MGKLMEELKQIQITYDKEGNTNFNYDMDEPRETWGILLNVMNAVITRMTGNDKELRYLSILEAAQFLKNPIEVNYPDQEQEVIIEADEIEEIA